MIPTTVKRLDPSLRMEDEDLIQALDAYPPKTRFKPGDIASIIDAPEYLLARRRMLPRYWQIRFVVSAWAYELMRLRHNNQGITIYGLDHAAALIEERRGLLPQRYARPIIYAHGFPHGAYPDTACWFAERCLRKLPLRGPTENWELILDEAKAPFLGYNGELLAAPFTFDIAPDLYSSGENLGSPFIFEETAFHTASLLGMEQRMLSAVDPRFIHEQYEHNP